MCYDGHIAELVTRALDEDVGRGDVTSSFLSDRDAVARGVICARERCVLSGYTVAEEVFRQVGATVVPAVSRDGGLLDAGDCVMKVDGPAPALLAGERVALNFLQRLSGVATMTRSFVDRLEGLSAQVVDTRKTTPGLRFVQKAAVRHGGGANHRFGLDDGILVKDNHLAMAAGLGISTEDMVSDLRSRTHHLLRVEVEVKDVGRLDTVLDAGVDAILLDNMSPETLEEAVATIRARVGNRVIIEASGNVSIETVREIAETGVDLISVGGLTHSAVAVDLSMEIEV